MPLVTVKAQVHADPETLAVLKDAMFCATKVYNGLLWHLRKEYEETGKTNVSRSNLNRILKKLPRAKCYYSMSVQLTRDEVIEAYRSFFALKKKGFTRHSAPGFRPKSYLSPLKYVQSGFRVEGDKVTVSLGTGREDGVRQVSFRISHRPGVEYERVRELSIIYDKVSGQIEARLVVEVKANPCPGTKRAALDLGETVLMAAAFEDGTVLLYSGRFIKSVRRYWQKVRASLKPNSRRWREVAHREKLQVEHLLHIATSHFIEECMRRGVGEIAIGDLRGFRESIDYGDKLNQRQHAWPYRKLINMLKYKGALAGIAVRDDVDEKNTSARCHACGRVLPSNRKSRGLYTCSCGWRAQADVNGSLNIFERAYEVSPVKGSNGRVARPVVLSLHLGWHGVHEPGRRGKSLRASL
ncbi:RNA-guided endonuclease InsQ/TnpB family protein [Ammonifex thiophilus]|uniref:Transposase n=1 Tax=Ammonifex thiophilus TaxID=444093 RepID=A0A3D8P604_9THEO|nr:RNA-guided endonuclease TnpB family protein [Ammonifex thiophilus]RDV84760.1 transposase [Ammonifex thiophilus]